MDVLSVTYKIKNFGSILLLTILVLNLIGVAEAGPDPVPPVGVGEAPAGGTGTGSAADLRTALRDLCTMTRNVLFVSAILLVVVGAAVYAIGQMLGSETRARATVWATSMFVGAIIGILIYVIVPGFLETLLSNGIEVEC